MYLKQGRLAKAQDWARERGLSADDEISYLGEFEHLTLARVLIAEYQSSQGEHSILQAIGLLERLLKAAEAQRRIGSVIEILLAQALAHQAQGNLPLALASLERALTLARAGRLRPHLCGRRRADAIVDFGFSIAGLKSNRAARAIRCSFM